ncbi:MAG: MFS transporter [Bacillota bacterium]
MTARKKRIVIFALVTGFFWFSLYTYIPTFSPYLENLGISHGFIGLILGSYGFVQMALRIPLGIWSDRINERKLFVIMGVGLGTVSALGLSIVENPYLILAFRSMAGMAAATWVTYTILFSTYFEREETSKSIGLINSFTKTGQVAAMLLGGIVAQYLGVKAPFLLGAVGGLAGFIISFQVEKKEVVDREPLEISELLQVMKNSNLIAVSLAAIIVQLITFSTTFGFIPVIARNLGAGDSQLGMLSVLANIPTIFAAVLAGTVFKDYFGEIWTIVGGFVILALSTVVAPYINTLEVLFLSQIIAGFSRGLIYPLLMALSIKKIADNQRATAMGFFQAVYGLGMFMGPVIVGYISDFAGLGAGFWFAGLTGILGAVFSKMYISNLKI